MTRETEQLHEALRLTDTGWRAATEIQDSELDPDALAARHLANR